MDSTPDKHSKIINNEIDLCLSNNKYELWKKINVPDDLFFKGITQAYWKGLYSNHRQLCQDKCEKWDFI
jgi:hypothetical protein